MTSGTDITNSGVLVRVLHGILALYRLVDAIRVISAATANSPLATALWTVPGG